jgi:hypothetical protein
MSKFSTGHKLPVARLVHINMGDWKDGKTLLIHMCHSTSKDSDGSYFWHTECGKNMEYPTVDPRHHTISEALRNNSGVKFCPRCGTKDNFLNAITAYEQYDIKENARRERERIAEQKENERKWNEMCALLGDEVADVLSKRPIMSGERDNEFTYTITRNGVAYNVTMKISEAK